MEIISRKIIRLAGKLYERSCRIREILGSGKRIKEDKHHPGVIMELSKSEAIGDIVRLIRLKVITYDDLSEFSDELQQEVKRILEMSR